MVIPHSAPGLELSRDNQTTYMYASRYLNPVRDIVRGLQETYYTPGPSPQAAHMGLVYLRLPSCLYLESAA